MVRGRVVGLRSAVPHEVNVVQGADAVGGAQLAAADAPGAVAFQVPVEKVLADQPVRVLLRQSAVRSASVQVEVDPDSASPAPR